jgi:subtilisin-like proprotein convertase family protein
MLRRALVAVIGLALAGLVAVPGTPAAAESQTFFNTSPLTFSGTAPGGASAYPATLAVTGLEGPITDVDLHLNAIQMGRLHYLQLLLVSPSGDAEIVKTHGCWDTPADTMQLTFDQQGATNTGDCVDGGVYKPFNACAHNPCPYFASFAAAGDANFDHFNGENANGSWQLYAYRDCHADEGACASTGEAVAGGWALSIDTGPVDVDVPAGGATHGSAAPYPASRLVSSGSGLITDLNVRLEGIWHSHPDDLEIMLEKVGGPRVVLMSDACGGFDAAGFAWVWDDEAPALMPDEGTTNVCSATVQRPTDRNPGDSLPSPAPPPPYGTSLSAFDLLDPGGEWRMWVADDLAGDEGFLTKRFTLEMTTRPRATTHFEAAEVTAVEGRHAELTVRRSGATAYAPGQVTVTTTPGTATHQDFTPLSTVLQFAAGETIKRLEVTVAANARDEDEERFTIALSSPSGDVALGSPSVATVVIPADDRVAPQTRLLKKPRSGSRRKARITFAASEDATFRCKVDTKAWRPCTSPLRLKNLKVGKHTVLVVAVDRAGNADPTPLKVTWRVKRRR